MRNGGGEREQALTKRNLFGLKGERKVTRKRCNDAEGMPEEYHRTGCWKLSISLYYIYF